MSQGRFASQPSQKRARSGAAKERDRPPDRLSRKNGISQKHGHQGPPQAAVDKAGPDLKEADGQEDEQKAGEKPGEGQGRHPPGGQPVESLDAPGDVGRA